VIAERAFRLTPPRAIHSYLPEILQTLGVAIERNEGQGDDDQFESVIEGRTHGERRIRIRVQLRGAKESWSHVGGNFLPAVFTTHVVSETQQRVEGAWQDTESSIKLLRQFNTKISSYVWHTSG
jgi:hypothetical protein